MKRYMKAFCTYCGAVVFLLSVLVFVFGGKDMITAFSKPVDVNHDFSGDYTKVRAVQTQIDMLMGQFASKTTMHNNSVDHDYYYVMPLLGKQETYYVAVAVDAGGTMPYEKVTDFTMEYLTGATDKIGYEMIEFEGGFTRMEDELYEAFKGWFIDMGVADDEELTRHVLPIVLESMNLERIRKLAFIFGGTLLISIAMLIYGFLPANQKTPAATNSIIMFHGISYPSSAFEKVNVLVWKGKMDQAARALQMIIGVGEMEADSIVRNWRNYW